MREGQWREQVGRGDVGDRLAEDSTEHLGEQDVAGVVVGEADTGLQNGVRPQLPEAFDHVRVAAEDAEARVGDVGKVGGVVDEVV